MGKGRRNRQEGEERCGKRREEKGIGEGQEKEKEEKGER